MKKYILFLIICPIVVRAKPIYSDYVFDGYTNQKEENELYRYDEVILNKFYKEYEADIEYLPLNNGLDNYTHVDMNDYKESRYSSYIKNSNLEHTSLSIGSFDTNYQTNTLSMLYINSYGNEIAEIEVYANERLIEANCSTCDLLFDKDYSKGITFSGERIFINLDSEYYLWDLRIDFIYKTKNDNRVSIQLQVPNVIKNGVSIGTKTYYLDVDSEKYSIRFMNKRDIANLLKDEYEPGLVVHRIYNYLIKNYKHYNIVRDYYEEPLETDSLDGYVFDSSESIKLYKRYARTVIGYEEEEKQTENPIIEEHNLLKDNSININENKETTKKLKVITTKKTITTSRTINKLNITKKVDTTKNMKELTYLTVKEKDRGTVIGVTLLIIIVGIVVFVLFAKCVLSSVSV